MLWVTMAHKSTNKQEVELCEAEEQFELDLPTKSHEEVISSFRRHVNAKT